MERLEGRFGTVLHHASSEASKGSEPIATRRLGDLA